MKILLVEDDPDMSRIAQDALAAAHFTVFPHATAQEALRGLTETRPDLALLDISLPDGTGIELCRAFRIAVGDSMPIIFLTSRNDVKTRLACFQLGAQDYILKPYLPEELIARVKVHLKMKVSHDKLARENVNLSLLNRARQDLTDMIVHDLKNPLSSIKGTLDLIKARGLVADVHYKRLTDCAGSAAEFMLLMLNDLLDIQRAEHTSLNVDLVATDIRVMMQKVRMLFAARLEQRGVSLDYRVPIEIAHVTTDANLLFRIMANLISNALTVSPKGGEIMMSCVQDREWLRISVADQGPGVPDAEKTRIFEKFHSQGPLDPLAAGGSGIGLSFCRAATAALKGRLRVQDGRARGSVFVLDLPRDQPLSANEI